MRLFEELGREEKGGLDLVLRNFNILIIERVGRGSRK